MFFLEFNRKNLVNKYKLGNLTIYKLEKHGITSYQKDPYDRRRLCR